MSTSGTPPNASVSAAVYNATPNIISTPAPAPKLAPKNTPEIASIDIPKVPFYSQFRDITAPEWQKLGCGVADLAMIIEYYKPGVVSVNTLLQEGIAEGAFQNGAGWIHKDLVLLARPYDLDGTTYDFSEVDTNTAFAQFKTALKDGPVIASVHYKLDPQNPIPHLVVINGIQGDTIYYNDPAEESGGIAISAEDFLKAWKKRFIVVRPLQNREVNLTK
ncbi:MAG TPA: C39 family peptidase [Candidatus Paceibacterota bacterium]